MLALDSLSERIKSYQNTTEYNDKIHSDFSQLVQEIPFLIQHRQYIEAHNLGFGDAAFHYMWYLILQHIASNNHNPKALEIGVFKGQTISLFALLSAQLNLNLSITAISPLKGNPLPKSSWKRRIKRLTSFKFREELKSGNFYPDEDYSEIIKNVFNHFGLDFSQVRMIQGLSNDISVLNSLIGEKFSLIYIDGDHTFKGVNEDIKNYSDKLEKGGILVMDDAGFYIPGSVFWKGHETVSRACEIIPSLGFVNILNVGHNRVYQKIS